MNGYECQHAASSRESLPIARRILTFFSDPRVLTCCQGSLPITSGYLHPSINHHRCQRTTSSLESLCIAGWIPTSLRHYQYQRTASSQELLIYYELDTYKLEKTSFISVLPAVESHYSPRDRYLQPRATTVISVLPTVKSHYPSPDGYLQA